MWTLTRAHACLADWIPAQICINECIKKLEQHVDNVLCLKTLLHLWTVLLSPSACIGECWLLMYQPSPVGFPPEEEKKYCSGLKPQGNGERQNNNLSLRRLSKPAGDGSFTFSAIKLIGSLSMPDHRWGSCSCPGVCVCVCGRERKAWKREAVDLCVMAPRSLPWGQACTGSRDVSPPLSSACARK